MNPENINPIAKTSFLFRRSLAFGGALLLALLHAATAYSQDVSGTTAQINFYMSGSYGSSSYTVSSPGTWNNIQSGTGVGANALNTLKNNTIGTGATSVTLTNAAGTATPWSLSISNLNGSVNGDTGHGSASTPYSNNVTAIWPVTARGRSA